MAISELLVKSALEAASSYLKRAFDAPKSPDLGVEDRLQNHIAKVEQWSREVQNFFMVEPVETDSETVSLSIDGIPRRFRGGGHGPGDTFSEKELLQSERSFILLGGPGAGKTTTLKRVARRFFRELASEEPAEFPWLAPILVVIRETSETEPIDLAIARSLGLPVTDSSGSNPQAARLEAPNVASQHSARPLHDHELKAILGKSRELRVGSASVREFIANLLNEAHALILLDGIDELPASSQPMIWQSIGDLKSRLANAKIIATCRTGDFSLSIEGISVSEIVPLTPAQISEIARRWLPDYGTFLNHLNRLPYADVATKPLFLCYLLTLFRYHHRLPERPRHVYQRVVSCALEE
jgi:Cdc6-like AAA superfamily ATPase